MFISYMYTVYGLCDTVSLSIRTLYSVVAPRACEHGEKYDWLARLIQWNLSIMDTVGTSILSIVRGCPFVGGRNVWTVNGRRQAVCPL